MRCILVILATIVTQFLFRNGTAIWLEFNPSHDGMRMPGHVFYNATSTGVAGCSYACMVTRDCLSFNYQKENQLCELNSENSTTAPGNLIYKDINHVFSDISVWPRDINVPCTSHNCSSVERCIPGPICILAFCPQSTPIVADSTIESFGVRSLGDTRLFECNTGYRMHGTSTIACQKDGIWSTPQFTCKDINECSERSHECDPNAFCSNTVGSYTCQCNLGWLDRLFGRQCNDIDECADDTDSCDANAGCTNTAGSYYCTCNTGYSGDGWSCSDVNECLSGSQSCDPNAACGNSVGSYDCTCNSGFDGNGWTCNDVDECSSGQNTCNRYETCLNTQGSYTCSCNSGSAGCYKHPNGNSRLCDGDGCGSASSSRGRLEVKMDGAWGSVCDDGWNSGGQWRENNILMVCKMFGYSSGTIDDYGIAMHDDGAILMDEVQCPLYLQFFADTIFACSFTNQHNCVHAEDIFIICY